MRRRHDPPDRLSMAGSLAVHSVALILAWWSSLQVREPMVFESYEIELVSPPPAQVAEEAAPAREELVVERPEPEPPPPAEEAPVTQPDPPRPQPRPDPPQPEPDPLPAEPEEEAAPATTTEEPEEEATESGEDINVRMEGLRRDYPAYYGNIIRQIERCFSGRWRGQGQWETTIVFVIRPDGTATDLRFATRSGNTSFDFEAMSAVECAGRGRFGALPEELPYERLPIQFTFRPGSGLEYTIQIQGSDRR